MTGTLFEARALTKCFTGTRVLRDLSFAVGRGETVAIVGRSGSGKSTLLKCLNLIEKPDAGELILGGDSYFHDGTVEFAEWEVRRSISLVFQEYNLFPNMTVLRNITLALTENFSVSRRQADLRAEQISEALGITTILSRYPNEISGGQAQRCALARSLLLKPKVLLLDEITSALDPESINDVVDAISTIRQIPENDGLAIVIVTHLIQFAVNFADRIDFLYGGRVHETHLARDFLTRASLPETVAFLNSHVRSLSAQ